MTIQMIWPAATDYDATWAELDAGIDGYQDANGVCHESYSAACEYYGADTPEQVEAEIRYHDAEDWIWLQDQIEARGPVVGTCQGLDLSYDLPF